MIGGRNSPKKEILHDTNKTTEVRVFQRRVEEVSGVPVYGVDERLSSQMAQRISGSTANLDSLAAQIILQNYLNQNSRKL
jgi:RNase H-fold protein (predicted Holliday junction resolvase)